MTSYTLIVLFALLPACATQGAALTVATTTSTTLGRVLKQIDDAEATRQQADRVAADAAHPSDDTAYHAALATDDAIADAIAVAWREYGLMLVAISVWSDANDPTLWREALPCMLDALGALRTVVPVRWRDPLTVAMAAAQQAPLGKCTRATAVTTPAAAVAP
jgi:hypothetical protein